ncbi:DUF2933 domain-containing protein [Cupriavidus necator]
MSLYRSPTRRRQSGRIGSGFIFAAFGLIALFFLFTEHRAHLFGWLPFLLLLACPLLHMFHGHGGHGDHAGQEPPRDSDSDAPRPSGPASSKQPPKGAEHHHH